MVGDALLAALALLKHMSGPVSDGTSSALVAVRMGPTDQPSACEATVVPADPPSPSTIHSSQSTAPNESTSTSFAHGGGANSTELPTISSAPGGFVAQTASPSPPTAAIASTLPSTAELRAGFLAHGDLLPRSSSPTIAPAPASAVGRQEVSSAHGGLSPTIASELQSAEGPPPPPRPSHITYRSVRSASSTIAGAELLAAGHQAVLSAHGGSSSIISPELQSAAGSQVGSSAHGGSSSIISPELQSAAGSSSGLPTNSPAPALRRRILKVLTPAENRAKLGGQPSQTDEILLLSGDWYRLFMSDDAAELIEKSTVSDLAKIQMIYDNMTSFAGGDEVVHHLLSGTLTSAIAFLRDGGGGGSSLVHLKAWGFLLVLSTNREAARFDSTQVPFHQDVKSVVNHLLDSRDSPRVVNTPTDDDHAAHWPEQESRLFLHGEGLAPTQTKSYVKTVTDESGNVSRIEIDTDDDGHPLVPLSISTRPGVTKYFRFSRLGDAPPYSMHGFHPGVSSPAIFGRFLCSLVRPRKEGFERGNTLAAKDGKGQHPLASGDTCTFCHELGVFAKTTGHVCLSSHSSRCKTCVGKNCSVNKWGGVDRIQIQLQPHHPSRCSAIGLFSFAADGKYPNSAAVFKSVHSEKNIGLLIVQFREIYAELVDIMLALKKKYAVGFPIGEPVSSAVVDGVPTNSPAHGGPVVQAASPRSPPSQAPLLAITSADVDGPAVSADVPTNFSSNSSAHGEFVAQAAPHLVVGAAATTDATAPGELTLSATPTALTSEGGGAVLSLEPIHQEQQHLVIIRRLEHELLIQQERLNSTLQEERLNSTLHYERLNSTLQEERQEFERSQLRINLFTRELKVLQAEFQHSETKAADAAKTAAANLTSLSRKLEVITAKAESDKAAAETLEKLNTKELAKLNLELSTVREAAQETADHATADALVRSSTTTPGWGDEDPSSVPVVNADSPSTSAPKAKKKKKKKKKKSPSLPNPAPATTTKKPTSRKKKLSSGKISISVVLPTQDLHAALKSGEVPLPQKIRVSPGEMHLPAQVILATTDRSMVVGPFVAFLYVLDDGEKVQISLGIDSATIPSRAKWGSLRLSSTPKAQLTARGYASGRLLSPACFSLISKALTLHGSRPILSPESLLAETLRTIGSKVSTPIGDIAVASMAAAPPATVSTTETSPPVLTCGKSSVIDVDVLPNVRPQSGQLPPSQATWEEQPQQGDQHQRSMLRQQQQRQEQHQRQQQQLLHHQLLMQRRQQSLLQQQQQQQRPVDIQQGHIHLGRQQSADAYHLVPPSLPTQWSQQQYQQLQMHPGGPRWRMVSTGSPQIQQQQRSLFVPSHADYGAPSPGALALGNGAGVAVSHVRPQVQQFPQTLQPQLTHNGNYMPPSPPIEHRDMRTQLSGPPQQLQRHLAAPTYAEPSRYVAIQQQPRLPSGQMLSRRLPPTRPPAGPWG